MDELPNPSDPQALIYAEEIRELYRRERARADELQRAKDDLERALRSLVAEVEERERVEQALRQAQKMEAIGQLAGGIAHDFNNLLSVIINYSELLRDALGEDPSLVEDADAIHDAGRRAATLTRQLLTFSRTEVVHPEVVELANVVGNLEQMLRRVIRESVQLNFELGGTWRVRIDPGQLEQVVLNLVVNARDAMPSGGPLSVATEDRVVDEATAEQHLGLAAGEYAALVVRDAGVGMDPEVLAHIYEPFFTTKPRGSGTGLGLATVYGIVKGADGYIMCDSQPGQGTSFTALFPRTSAAPQGGAARSSGAQGRGRGEKVLVVDDDPAVRRVVSRLLSSRGFEPYTAASGNEALGLMRTEQQLDAAVIDLVMPGNSGAPLVQAVRSLRPRLPLLLMSGYGDDVLQQHGISELDIPSVRKPIDPDGLVTALADVIARAA